MDQTTTITDPEAVATDSHSVALRNVTKRFDTFTAVDDLSLELGQGEFFTFLGPSGCGKTTTLRMIAGFERPDEGEIRIEGSVVKLPADESDAYFASRPRGRHKHEYKGHSRTCASALENMICFPGNMSS